MDESISKLILILGILSAITALVMIVIYTIRVKLIVYEAKEHHT